MNECYGCVLKNMMTDGKCFIVFEEKMHFINKSKCPCQKCLLKMICQTSCQEFLNPKGDHIGENYIRRTT